MLRFVPDITIVHSDFCVKFNFFAIYCTKQNILG